MRSTERIANLETAIQARVNLLRSWEGFPKDPDPETARAIYNLTDEARHYRGILNTVKANAARKRAEDAAKCS